MMKYTTGWDNNGKIHPIYVKGMGTRFPELPHLMGFADVSNAIENLMNKHMHFPCNEVYRNLMEKGTYTVGKVLVLLSQVLPIRSVL